MLLEITELDQLGGPEEQDEEQEGVELGAVPPAAGAEEAEADAGAGLGTPAPQVEQQEGAALASGDAARWSSGIRLRNAEGEAVDLAAVGVVFG